MFDNIVDVSKLTLSEGDVLIVRLGLNNMPKHIWQREASAIKTAL
jgi:hypothetical protein